MTENEDKIDEDKIDENVDEENDDDLIHILDQIDTTQRQADDNAEEINELREKHERLKRKAEKQLELLNKRIEHLQTAVESYETTTMQLKKQIGGDIVLDRRKIEQMAARHLVDAFSEAHSMKRRTKIVKR